MIKEGSHVNIYFVNDLALRNVEVICTPCATGDCFKVQDKWGDHYNVQNYSYMEELPKD